MAILLAGLFDPSRDILLVSDPSYIGITGIARILGIRVMPVPAGDEGLDATAVEESDRPRLHGRPRPRAVRHPRFQQSARTSLPLAQRLRLLDVCARHGVLIIEDNPYGMFAYDDERPRTLKALDRAGIVIYVGSFAKTLFPSLRVGYLVADQHVGQRGEPLAKALSRVKSLLTVNTSTLCQAIVADALDAAGGSLEPLVAPKRAMVKRNRDVLVDCLRQRFADLRARVTWNEPRGGFFLTLSVPFEFDARALTTCAAEYGVIVCPMTFFCLAPSESRRRQIRLAFSAITPAQIACGIERLSDYVHTCTTILAAQRA